ncbi:MAG: type transport system permease protein, partial [Bacteroidota bacterium]|nr:type transport system permease protein [Bacteroidota bacterium]
MNNLVIQVNQLIDKVELKIRSFFGRFKLSGRVRNNERIIHPFRVIVNKEISDHVKSFRFIILIVIIALTCLGSFYTAMHNIAGAIKPNDPEGSFLFLKLFTVSDNTMPPFF